MTDFSEPLDRRAWRPTGDGPFAISYHVGARSPTRWITGLDRYPTLEAAEIQAVNMVRREARAELTPIVRKGVRV